MRKRHSLVPASLLLGGAALCATGVALADELLALVATDLEEHNRVDRVQAVPSSLMSDIGVTMRLGGALATADGTDLLLFGQDVGTGIQYFWRVGRTASGPGALSGGYHAIMGHRVQISATAATPRAAWVGTELRHIALATGDTRVTFHEPLERVVSGVLAPQTPPGWPTSMVDLPPGISALHIAAGSPTRLYVAGGGTAAVARLEPGATATCTINGGGVITALAGLPGGGAVAATSNGTLAVLEPTCAGPVDPATGIEPGLSFTGLDALAGAPVRVFASGSNGVLRAYELSGTSLLNPVSQSVDVGGAVAAGSFGGIPHALVGGLDSGFEGYRLRRLVAGSFTAVFDGFERARVAVRSPDPDFGLSHRIVELDSLPQNQRVSLLRVYGAAGKSLRLHAGTCQRTSVLDAYDMGGSFTIGRGCAVNSDCPSGTCSMIAGAPRCAPVLAPMAASGTYRAPSNDAVLAIAQGAQGEDCQMILANDPAASPGRGGGALLRVRGSTLGDRAFALVLDKSGSMFARVDPSAASGPGSEVRVDALRAAVGLLIDTVAALPDASQAKFAVFPFNQQSAAGVLPAAGLVTGTDLRMTFMDSVLSPGGATNIRGALKSAADRLAQQPGLSERSILLLTDGLHNTVGAPETNGMTLMGDDVNNLEPPLPTAGSTSAYLTGPGPLGTRRVDRLYAVGLSPMAAHPSLVNLVRHVNAPSSLEPIPPGYLDYSLRGNEVAQFFSKVLWGYLGATEFLDPIVSIDTNAPYTREFQLARIDRELIIVISWLDPRRPLQESLTHVESGGTTQPVLRSCQRFGQEPGGRIVCYVDPQAIKSTGRFTLTVRKDVEAAPGPVEAMIEVAGRSAVRLRTAFGEMTARTGRKLRMLATLTEQGLPIPPQRGGKVTGTLSMPAGALSNALADLKADAARIDELRRRDPDLYGTAAAAKFALLPKEQVPGRREQPVELFDDGQHGDGQAGDGVYGLEIDAKVPGIYRAQLRGEYNTPLSGAGFREGSLATQVVVGVDAKKSVVRFESYVPATKERRGSFRVVLRPQDGLGNLLGPGNGADLLFRQGDRTLPAKVTEPDALDGSYVAEVSEVREEGRVVLVGSGGGSVLLFDPACEPDRQDCRGLGPEPGPGGCTCRLGPGAQTQGPALLLGLLGLALLLRRRGK